MKIAVTVISERAKKKGSIVELGINDGKTYTGYWYSSRASKKEKEVHPRHVISLVTIVSQCPSTEFNFLSVLSALKWNEWTQLWRIMFLSYQSVDIIWTSMQRISQDKICSRVRSSQGWHECITCGLVNTWYGFMRDLVWYVWKWKCISFHQQHITRESILCILWTLGL